MPLLSQPSKAPRAKSTRAKRAPIAPLVVAIVGNKVEAKLGDVTVTATPEGALWIDDAKTLIVSDLHLEKGSSFARDGQMLPPYDTHATLSRVAALMEQLAPEIVVSLGDSFHDGGGPARMNERDRALLQSLIGRCDWIWVEGNHDGRSAETIGGVVRESLSIGALNLVHKPSKRAAPGEIAGHLHPCAKVSGRGRVVRRRCFATDGARLVMPAFGAFTGGLNVCHEEFAPLFPNGVTALVMGRTRVLPAPMERLLED
jgi:DNA ligase-associated metallophosphoesterase